MINLIVHTEDELAFEDFGDKEIIHLTDRIRIAGLDHGMSSGEPSVAFGFELGDGKVVIAETSLALFLSAADILRAKFNL